MQNIDLRIGEYRIVRIITGEEWKENCYWVYDRQRNIQYVIDPGYQSCLLLKPFLVDTLESSNLRSYVLLTHPHHDHIAGAEEICEKLSVSCWISPKDKRIYMHVGMYALKFAKKMLKRPEKVAWLEDEMFIQLSKQGVTVIETPGHTAGSICFDFGEFIFTGDTLLNKKIGRTDLPGADRSLLTDSIERLMTFQGKKVIYPGHGQPWEISEAIKWWQDNKACAEELNTFI